MRLNLTGDKAFSAIKRLGFREAMLILFFLFLTFFLVARASNEYRWSDWGFGDAQSMLSLKQWEEGGWLANYLLFIPQGYAKVVRLFDDPELRQHAHGTCPGSSPRVGPRLWYTHYPAGYLIPYALLFRLGIDSIAAMRILSILFSVSALALMYLVFSKITGRAVSFIAVVFYSMSAAFLGYADTIANQPIDDLLRFAFMLAVVMSTRAESSVHQRRWGIAAWVIEFCLSLVSFDSVFFLFTWLVGWDLLEKKGFRWRRYIIFGMAPVTAHGLQFMQNVWYLGFTDAVIDIKDAFLLKYGSDESYNAGQGRIGLILASVYIVLDNILNPPVVIVVLIALLIFYLVRLKSGSEPGDVSFRLLFVLFVSGLSFIVVLPHAARMPYEARQMLPFASLLVASVTRSSVMSFKKSLQQGAERHGQGAAIAYLCISSVVILLVWYRFGLQERRPVYYIPKEAVDERILHESGPQHLPPGYRLKNDILFVKELQKLRTRYEPVYFSVLAFEIYWDPSYVPGYPQIMPITEYYAGSSPILCFDQSEKAASDISYLLRRSRAPFSPVIISSEKGRLEAVIEALIRGSILNSAPEVNDVGGRYVADLTEALRKGNQ